MRHRFQVILLRLFILITTNLSVQINQKIGRLLGKVGYYLGRKDRAIARYQLEFCFPEKSEEEREQIVKDCFQSFGQSFMEILSKQKIRKNREKWIKFQNEQVLYSTLAEGKGAVILVGHFGNWELSTILYEMLDVKGKAIVRPVDTKGLEKFLQKSRESTHLKIIPRGDPESGKMMLQCFKKNEILLLAIDQDTKAQSHFVDFFGRKAKTPKVAGSFALKFSVPIISAFNYRNPDGTHQFNFELVSTPPYKELTGIELTQLCSNAIEKHIRSVPSQWAWFHRRWKTQPDE